MEMMCSILVMLHWRHLQPRTSLGPGVLDRELLLSDCSFFCELARRRKSQSNKQAKVLVMLRVKSGKSMHSVFSGYSPNPHASHL